MALLLAMAVPAFASPLSPQMVVGNAPLSVAVGAAIFAILAMMALRRLAREGRAARTHATAQIASLRAQLDSYEAVLAAAPEVTVLWPEHGGRPHIFGQAPNLLPPGRRAEAVMDFPLWLSDGDIARLAAAVEGLRVSGQGFALTLKARDGILVRATGNTLGAGAVMRLSGLGDAAAVRDLPQVSVSTADARALLGRFDLPAFTRNADGQLDYANPAYAAFAQRLGLGSGGAPAELLDVGTRARHLQAVAANGRAQTVALTLPAGRFELVEFPLGAGTAGYLRPAPAIEQPITGSSDGRAAALVEALPVPVAVFGARRELVAFNSAYADLWKLEDWLKPGLDERVILDRLRRDGLLPTEPDYQGWKTRHLGAYGLKQPRTEAWHLPDGRMLNVTAAPAGADGGVIYLFEDLSREMELVSQNRALLSVQRSTLNALSDAVAVFGTNGRLQLSNPRLASLWRLPADLIARNPHIDQIAEAAAENLPEDGADIWRELKRAVIDLSPTRTDISGRLTRSDGRLIDYGVVRLPDGQKLLTFLDVTESANYSKVLKERNDALVTADRLKDAFVQNVSYELRSPLTNIIGFADLLASPEMGPLNERQRAYTDYIRASSVTLGVLIDNILDLATVDAGIAELRPAPQDVSALVEKARAAIAATFPDLGDGSGVHFTVSMAPNLPAFVADGTRIVQILYNLLSTAARFSEPGGEVRLSAAARGERMLFTIEDDGAALTDELRAALLERPEGGLAGRDRGAGLSLAIVRAFVNLHGGTISVDRRPRGGSRVVVNLPLDAAAATSTAAE